LAYTVKSMNAASMRAELDVKTMVALGEAKSALIAWSVAHKSWPGLMPFPDRLEAVLPNYDGRSDCPGGATLNSHLIGKLPWKAGDYNHCTNLLDGLGKEYVGADNEVFWYAVSKNVVHIYSPSSNPVINPNITDSGWLRVLDAKGKEISNRVAVVIIAPGRPLSGQDRSGATPPIGAFLDEIVIGGTTYSNRDYNEDSEDFIMGDTTNSTFNDRLVYITIDELVAAIANRVSSEAGKLLNKYNLKNTYFPNAAPLGASTEYISGTSVRGKLPIDVTDNCNCLSANSCSCKFNSIASIAFIKNGIGDWSGEAGSCIKSGKACTCTGAGNCSYNGNTFLCDVNGLCIHDLVDGGEYQYSIPSYADILDSSSSCAINSDKAVCTGAGGFRIGLKEPDWFKLNRWQDYIYYEWSPTSSLESGGRTGVSALLVSAGAPIVNAPFSFKGSAQLRPSNNIADYLDSEENINGGFKFEATNKQKTHIYNDQVFIVSP
jgi:hypothetical protein